MSYAKRVLNSSSYILFKRTKSNHLLNFVHYFKFLKKKKYCVKISDCIYPKTKEKHALSSSLHQNATIPLTWRSAYIINYTKSTLYKEYNIFVINPPEFPMLQSLYCTFFFFFFTLKVRQEKRRGWFDTKYSYILGWLNALPCNALPHSNLPYPTLPSLLLLHPILLYQASIGQNRRLGRVRIGVGLGVR